MESGLKCRKFLAEESASKLILGVQVLAGRLPLPHSLPSKTQNQGDSLIFPGLTHGPKKIQVKHQVSHKLHSDSPIFPEEKKQRKNKTGGRNLQTASQTKDFLNITGDTAASRLPRIKPLVFTIHCAGPTKSAHVSKQLVKWNSSSFV